MRRMAMNSMLGKATLAVAGALLLAGSALAQNTIKIGVITGAAQGIGRGVARSVAAEGGKGMSKRLKAYADY